MTYQVSVKDFRDAIAQMKSNIAVVKCADNMFASIQFLTKEDGTPYYTVQYQVGNVCRALGDNYPVSQLVKEFNSMMLSYSENQ